MPDKTVYNLGLLRIQDSFTSVKCVEMFHHHLLQFGVHRHHIIAVTTDYCSVMAKFGRLLDNEHQPCYVHGIQLAICDVLYFRRGNGKEKIDSAVELQEADNDDIADAFIVSTEEEDIESAAADEYILKENIQDAISGVRRLVKVFKHSGLCNDALQKHVKNKFGHELCVILDVKTRWSSMFNMISRFLKLKDCIKKTLDDFNLTFDLSEYQMEQLVNIELALKPMALIVEVLSGNSVTLLSAATACDFAVNELERMDNEIAQDLASSLQKRVKQRENSVLLLTGQFLLTGKKLHFR